MISLYVDKGNIMRKSFFSDPAKHSNGLNTEKILFIDDDQDIAHISKRVLESLGYKVTIQQNAIEAFQLFRQKPDRFDLIVTDLVMPDMNGLALSKKILDIRPDIPIILSTGCSENTVDKENLPEGVSGILVKPATTSELKAAVRSAIGSPV